ncbi:uncharacterized protein LOC132164941 [Corylus avellana]|uniref:uncharacterized protein LOC132164941 n=1 Tax=Corylus avellana TaxID=13451 RepID=UPI00286B4BC5|nr:uncharacterized protein LOC132164941 [Corylus avellana]
MPTPGVKFQQPNGVGGSEDNNDAEDQKKPKDMAPNLTEKITTSSHGDESYSGRKDQKPKENGVVKGGGNQQNDVDRYGEEIESKQNRRTTGTGNIGDGGFSTSKEERQRNQKQEDIQININIRLPSNDSTKMIMTTKAPPPPEDQKKYNKQEPRCCCSIL